jgi:Tol biopolymer transport system component
LSRQIRIVLVVAMVAFGIGVYLLLANSKSMALRAASVPTTEHGIALSGTIYVAQGGSLYSYAGGAFTKLPSGSGHWMQPALTPDRSKLVAVNRAAQSSDIYLLGLDGRVVRQLTHNQRSSKSLDLNHWSFYPRPAADGQILYSYDSPKSGFLVDLAIWQMPLGGAQAQAVRRTAPNDYTGGDVFPNPLSSGAVLYAKYSIKGTGSVYSQLWIQAGPRTAGTELTQPVDDCGQPALSPDGARVAMICTSGQQSGRLELATFDGQQHGRLTPRSWCSWRPGMPRAPSNSGPSRYQRPANPDPFARSPPTSTSMPPRPRRGVEADETEPWIEYAAYGACHPFATG